MKLRRLASIGTIAIVVASCSCYSQSVCSNIVLINTGTYDKERIAKEITVINNLNPKVISIDVDFSHFLGSKGDKELILALQNCKGLVRPSAIHSDGEDYFGKEIITVYSMGSEFFPRKAKAGFVSTRAKKGQVQIPRQFTVWQRAYGGNDIYHHFSIVTAMIFDSLKAVNFMQSHDSIADVDYNQGKRNFKIFSAQEVLDGKITKKDIEGKIIMLGFLGPGNDDKFSTPFNTNPKEPDMYGVEYLANIVAQVLENE